MLTSRELEVLECVSRGHIDDRIAMNLDISLSTVRAHVHSILIKTGCTNRTSAAVWYVTQQTHQALEDEA